MSKNSNSKPEEISILVEQVFIYWTSIWNVLKEDKRAAEVYSSFGNTVQNAIDQRSKVKLRAILKEFSLWLVEWPPESVSRIVMGVKESNGDLRYAMSGKNIRRLLLANSLRSRYEFDLASSALGISDLAISLEDREKLNTLVSDYESKKSAERI